MRSFADLTKLKSEMSKALLAHVRYPEDMYKVYDWHRGGEDFSTLEVIAQPFYGQPRRGRPTAQAPGAAVSPAQHLTDRR